MRLICPNCGAQYEVPVDVIPDGGRDVQCSNCGHTWYQRHPDDDPDLADELQQPVPDTQWQDDPEPQAPAPEVAEPEAPAQEAPKPRGLDPDMAALFQEEREYEARQRAAETIESQPDLGLQDPVEDEQTRRSRQARERMARLRGDERTVSAPTHEPGGPTEDEQDSAMEAAAAAAAASSRRDLLPDVDEINQTLRASNQPRAIDSAERETVADVPPAKKGGFGGGFLTMIVLGGAATGVYAFAAQIAETVPQVQPLLDSYVAAVDNGRVWLDQKFTELLQALDGFSSEASDARDAASDTPTE
ncbi:MAG: zinc-ribbon domain-containing protein [Pelagimonas sp.]